MSLLRDAVKYFPSHSDHCFVKFDNKAVCYDSYTIYGHLVHIFAICNHLNLYVGNGTNYFNVIYYCLIIVISNRGDYGVFVKFHMPNSKRTLFRIDENLVTAYYDEREDILCLDDQKIICFENASSFAKAFKNKVLLENTGD